MSWVRKLLCLSGSERRLLLRAALTLGAVRLGLWLLPFRSVWKPVSHAPRAAAPPPAGGPPSAERIAWSVATAARLIPKANCLTRAMAAQVLLQGAGFPARLRLGVARGGGDRIEAHAWVESLGKVFGGGPGLERFTPLPSFGEEGA